MQSEHLSSSPIKEAIIEFRLNQKIATDDLSNFGQRLPDGYSEFQPVIQQELGFTFKDGEIHSDSTKKGTVLGYRSDNSDLTTVVVFESDKFRFSKLAPYSDWEDFKSQAMAMWELFKPSDIQFSFSRIATRYVNEINLPLIEGKLDFDQYLTTCPKIPKDMPDALARFLSKVAIPYVDERAMASVTLASGEPQENHLPVTLDIDVFRTEQLTLSDRELWNAMGVLRDIKNTAFFGSITENTRELLR